MTITAFREEVRSGLERAGYEVTVSPSGNRGVEDFRRGRQDLVITDVVMDQGEGIETLQRLRELAPELPVIALSGHPPYLEIMTTLGAPERLPNRSAWPNWSGSCGWPRKGRGNRK